MPQNDPTTTPIVPLYQHRKATEWGLGMLAWERGPRRGYQFEDGKLRVFGEGFYELLDEVDAPADQAREVIAKLTLQLGDLATDRAAPVAAPADVTLDEQIAIFRIQHPDGFAGDAWQAARRGVEQGRRLKRHRVPALAEAAERLAAATLQRALDDGTASEVVASLIEMLAATDLVSATQLEPLRTLPPSRHGGFVQALHELLWTDTIFALRFERFVATLALTSKRAPTWSLITAFGALVHPGEHLYVRPATISKQARFMAPRLALGANPDARSYLRALEMVRRVADGLVAARLAPADLLDVHDFMVDTLAPSARALLTH